MNNDSLHYPVGPVAMKMAVAVGIGMLIGMERKWAHKEAGIRTFSIVALLGTLSAVISAGVRFDRVYSGLHYPTDILGSFLLGGLMAYLAYLICFVLNDLMPFT
jgi:uncharacterized membrane protein YhiD involved in acid resistance